MKTFSEVLNSNSIFDASGIDNPNQWLWDNNTFTTSVYYPVKQIEVSETDIKEGAKFKTKSGIVWIIDSIENDLVRTSMQHGQKGNYRDSIQTVVDFLNEGESVKL